MGDFKNGTLTKILTTVISVVIMGVNIFTIYGMIFAPGATYQSDKWYVILPLALFFVVYFAFVMYLVPYLFDCLGYESLASKAWVRKYYRVEQFNQLAIKT